MRKTLTVALAIFIPSLLASCGGYNFQKICEYRSPTDRWCNDEGDMTPSEGETFDGSKLEISYAGSTAQVVGNFLLVNAVAKSGGQIIASDSFVFARSGSSFSPQSPSALSSFVNSYRGLADKFEWETSGYTVEASGPGTNVVESEIIYDNQVEAGNNYSWYVNQKDWLDDQGGPGGV